MNPAELTRPQTNPQELLSYSFDSQAEHASLAGSSPEEIARQLTLSQEAYVAEVVADLPCSPIYSMWLDGQYAYSTPEKKPKDRMDKQFDMNERDGVPLLGFARFTQLMRKHPGEVILWRSPRGPAAFHEHAGAYSSMKFDYDQAYLGIYDEEKGEALTTAIKSNIDEGTEEFFPEHFATARQEDMSEEDEIKYNLVCPRTTGMTYDEFISHNWDRQKPMYRDKEGRINTIGDILDHVGEAVFKHHTTDLTQTDTYQKIYLDAKLGRVDQRYVRENVYLDSIRKYMDDTGKKEIALGGSCGGSTVSRNRIDGLEDPLESLKSNMSSKFRTATQGNMLGQDSRKLTAEEAKNAEGVCKCGKPHEAHFHCPDTVCNSIILIGKGIDKCPGCGKDGTCA